MTESINHFLLTFDIGRQTAQVEEFGTEYEMALVAYGAAEERHRSDPQIEVVLLGADSLETLRRTHSSYFMGTSEDHPFAPFLRGVRAHAG